MLGQIQRLVDQIVSFFDYSGKEVTQLLVFREHFVFDYFGFFLLNERKVVLVLAL